MSSIGAAVHKIFRGVTKVWHAVWKPLVIAAAIYFTGGLALGAMGAMAAGGSALAGAGAGLSAAAGGIGIGAGAGIGGAFAAGAATAGEAALAGGALAAGGAAAAGAGAAADLGGAGVLTAEGAEAAGLGGAAAAGSGAAAGGSVLGALDSGSALAGTAGLAGGGGASTAAAMGGGMTASSLWDSSLGIAKSVLGTPGVPSLISGVAQGLMSSNLQNAQMKWAEQHAPGQVAGGTGGAWGAPGSFPANKNLTPRQPTPTTTKLPQPVPYTQTAQQVPLYQVGSQPMPGTNEPGPYTRIGGQWQGYGTPGYGMQYPPGTQPGAPYPPTTLAQQQMQPGMQPGLLGGGAEQMPFIESPYDESYV